jgi:hypothetical protein
MDDVIKLGMQQRLSATDGDYRGAKIAELVNPFNHLVGRNRLRKIIKLVAVGASKIAATDRNQVREKRMIG